MSLFSEIYMERESLRIPVPMFWYRTSPFNFCQLLKVPMSLVCRLNIRILIYLDDMLLMSQSIERLLVERDTIIFFLQLLRSAINFKKAAMKPV